MPRFRVYYPLRAFLEAHPMMMFDGAGVELDTLRNSHRMVAVCEADDLEDVFEKMQGENWSPNGEAYDLIVGLGVTHTSMSVGDVVVDEDDVAHLCGGVGWRALGKLAPARA